MTDSDVLRFTVLVWTVVISTTIWVGFDAKQVGRNPGAWVVGCILLWIVAFPIYLITRPKKVVVVHEGLVPEGLIEARVTDAEHVHADWLSKNYDMTYRQAVALIRAPAPKS